MSDKKTDEREPDVVLNDGDYKGHEVFIDFSSTSRGEYRELFNKNSTEARENEILSKCCDLKPEDFDKMSIWDFRRFMSVYHVRASNPVADPKN